MRLHHVQVSCPPGGEDAARRFYGAGLGLPEVAKPPELAGRGGCWFRDDGVEVHVGVEPGFSPARKAHPAFLVEDLDATVARLAERGFPVDRSEEHTFPGHRRVPHRRRQRQPGRAARRAPVATYGSVGYRRRVSTPLSQTQMLQELEPVVEENLNRHLSMAKEWFPHEYVPWSEGRTYDGPLGGEPWKVDDSAMTDVARSALIVNLLTEDNLPSYHHEIATLFGRDAAWGDWVHRWTAEEGRHGIAIRDYLLVTRSVDPTQLEQLRMQHMSTGYSNGHPDDMLASLAYVSFQELATRVSHRNTGRVTDDPVADQLLARVAADENLHMVFYRNLLGAALEIAPDQTMRAITDVVTTFQMPGADIAGFQRKAVEMAIAGVYDIRQHKDDVVAPVLRYWKVFELEGLGAEGEQARTELADFLEELEKQALRFEEKRDKLQARMAARSGR